MYHEHGAGEQQDAKHGGHCEILVPARIERDPDILQAFLTDAAHVTGGAADGVAFPADAAEVSALVAGARRVLPVGAQSSLTGGATPRGDLVLSTRGLTTLTDAGPGLVRAGAGVPLADLQRALAGDGLYFPPVPTFHGAFVGGVVATNAAGAATFKYGATRPWVEALTVVLADGSIHALRRGEMVASPDGVLALPGGGPRVPVPAYTMPTVAKLSAGYFAAPGMDLIDLFIGAEGTLGVIVDATLRVVARPAIALALVPCRDDAQAVALTGALRNDARAAWRGDGPLDVAGVELMDTRSLALVGDDAFAQAGTMRPAAGTTLLLLHLELPDDADAALARLVDVLDSAGIDADPALALPGDDAAAARLLGLREAVPAAVNARVAAAQATTDAAIQKTAGDMVVPFERLGDSLTCYRDAFESRGLTWAVWGHASDGNLHPNVVPASLDDVESGREALVDIARTVMAMGGAPLAEHGVGRNPLKQRFLRDLYGDVGLAQMRAVRRTLDPDGKLARGVLFPESDT
jgi:D-lactate dehydrogenase (cytochrome)